MAPATRSRQAGAHDDGKPASAASKQPKLEQSMGVGIGDASSGQTKANGDGNRNGDEGVETTKKPKSEASSGDKRERGQEEQKSNGARDAAADGASVANGTEQEETEPASKAPKVEQDANRNGSNQTHERILPGAEEPPRQLGPGKEQQADGDDSTFQILEEGHIYFFYRPKVQGADEADKKGGKAAESIDDVQNTHMLLVPQASVSSTAPADPATAEKAASDNAQQQQQQPKQQPAGVTGDKARQQGVGFRLVRLGKKRLPAPEEALKQGVQPGGIGGDSSEAVWSVIADVGPDVSALAGEMGERRYSTRTRGERVVGPSRMAGRGRYSFVLHKSDPPSSRRVAMCYALSHPSKDGFGSVQEQLGLLPSGSILVSMRNPTLPSTGAGAPPAGLPESDRVQMDDKELEHAFGGHAEGSGTRYARPEDLEMLDREGVELLLTRARIPGGSGGEHKSAVQDARSGAADAQAVALEQAAQDDANEQSVKQVLGQLQMTTTDNPPDALEGTWV